LIFQIAAPLISFFIAVSSIFMGLSIHPLLLLSSATGFSICQRFANKGWTFFWGQLFFLGLLHWSSGLNWSFPLYLILVGLHDQRELSPVRSHVFAAACIAVYSAIFVTFSGLSTYDILLMTLSILCFFMAVPFLHKVQSSTHDRLTGLLNFEEFHRRLGNIVNKEQELALILMDCNDLKSMNDSKGFEKGNMILKQMAELLNQFFPEAIMSARYGGDEFAVVIRLQDVSGTIKSIIQRFRQEIPKRTGIVVTYGIATFPHDAATKDDLILVAEKQLFTMKREQWLKREEHLFRAEKLKVIGELASGMAHEIRNPLTTIKGFIQLSKANGYHIENWYQLIMDEISRMSELTAEFLQFSKPHATHFKNCSLQDCIFRVISLMDSEANRLGHTIRCEAPPDPVVIRMDQDKIVQMLLNLVRNAFDAMTQKGVVNIRLSTADKFCRLDIEDTGKGIPDEELDQIFHPFYTSKEEGTGLGLSICHKIVQDHDGMITVKSEPGKGSTFSVHFPLAIAGDSNA